MSVKNVAVLGASGNLGPAIVKELVAAGYNTTVIVRPTSSATATPGAALLKSEYTHDGLRTALKGQDAVVSTLNPQALDSQKVAADVSAELGVKRFIPSEFGSDTSQKRVQELVPIFGDKLEIVNHLREREGKLSWTAISCGPFFDWGIRDVPFLGFNIKTKTADIWDGGNVRHAASNLHQIGKAVAKVLAEENLEKTKNQHVFTESFHTSQNEVLALLEKYSGAKWTVNKIDSKTEIPKNLEKLGKGDYSVIPAVILGHMYKSGEGEIGLADWRRSGGSWNERLGLEYEDVDATIKSFF